MPTKKGKESSEIEDSSTQSEREEDNVAAGDELTDDEEDAVSCTALCCTDSSKAYQPTNKQALSLLTQKGRNFQPQWYKQFTWLTVCMTSKKVYCLYCRYAVQHKMITFIKTGEKAFTENGFINWRKAMEKFRSHECSHTHKEALMKWNTRETPTIAAELSSQLLKQQQLRREGLVLQLRAILYLARQGIAIRGHTEAEGNLQQLLKAWSHENEVIISWLNANRFSSHQFVNELIDIMGHTVLRTLLKRMKGTVGPAWFSVIADEATDINQAEQLNVSIRWVDDNYCAHEDPIGLFKVPDTKAETLFKVIKDLLIRCNLPLALCRGQAYDGASNMQGRRTGVATRVLSEQPAAIPIHCCAHSLNLCLQDAGRKLICIRDALEVCREITGLIRFSPKRLHLFSSKLAVSSSGGPSLKPLSTTRWTARTAAIDTILKDYVVLMETMEEVQATTHDEYGLKAGGCLHSLEKFGTLFGLRLAHILFGATEQVSLLLQKKDIAIHEALSGVDTAKAYFSRLRSDEEFDSFYDATLKIAEQLSINQPVLPRRRRCPSRLDDGAEPHQYSSPKEYHRRMYFEACDLLITELEERFESQNVPTMLSIEQALVKASNGDEFDRELSELKESCYKHDIDWCDLNRHLAMLQDIMRKDISLKKVTSVTTICDVMNSNQIYKDILPSVHLLLRLYKTLPITSATSERTFSALRRLYTYLRSSMTECRLNNCLLLHVHKDITDSLDLIDVASEFVNANTERKRYFGHF